MSGRDKNAKQRLREKYVKRSVNKAASDVVTHYDELKLIQADFEPNFIPISFVIVEHENKYFARPSMTIDELLISESLRNRIQDECIKVGIDSTLLGCASVVPVVNAAQTIEQWVRRNSENSIYIVFKYKTEFLERRNEQQMGFTPEISAEPPVTNEHVARLNDLKKVIDEQNGRIDEFFKSIQKLSDTNENQNSRIQKLNDTIENLNSRIINQDDTIENQNSRIKSQGEKIESLKSAIRSLCISTKPLVYLHRRILIEKFRLHLVKKYRDLFENQTGIVITDQTKYYDIYQHLGHFLNELHSGSSSSFITSTIEKQCLERALGHTGSYYQVTSEKFIHDASKDSIGESVLRSDGAHKQMWINMFILVYHEEPNLGENAVDIPLVPDDDSDDIS